MIHSRRKRSGRNNGLHGLAEKEKSVTYRKMEVDADDKRHRTRSKVPVDPALTQLFRRVTHVGVGSDGVNESLSALLEEGGQAVIGYRFLASPFSVGDRFDDVRAEALQRRRPRVIRAASASASRKQTRGI
ncbi:hypothetical protein EYF80_024330 [Liparis tanakae]|uniref:Uncharacterized protein n=1 Tax=Liparis tanakae TaxID=230148 RepID=A0A4Z2HIU4_9TELE|nr:hypothetical protein EYF80_024330 [Liparis tanakae]